ncbi:unnamed protein product [Closterium sp. Naga37s-1]|nr:unnamed protein product [Closterium sp. Naga37s-1]
MERLGVTITARRFPLLGGRESCPWVVGDGEEEEEPWEEGELLDVSYSQDDDSSIIGGDGCYGGDRLAVDPATSAASIAAAFYARRKHFMSTTIPEFSSANAAAAAAAAAAATAAMAASQGNWGMSPYSVPPAIIGAAESHNFEDHPGYPQASRHTLSSPISINRSFSLASAVSPRSSAVQPRSSAPSPRSSACSPRSASFSPRESAAFPRVVSFSPRATASPSARAISREYMAQPVWGGGEYRERRVRNAVLGREVQREEGEETAEKASLAPFREAGNAGGGGGGGGGGGSGSEYNLRQQPSTRQGSQRGEQEGRRETQSVQRSDEHSPSGGGAADDNDAAAAAAGADAAVDADAAPGEDISTLEGG